MRRVPPRPALRKKARLTGAGVDSAAWRLHVFDSWGLLAGGEIVGDRGHAVAAAAEEGSGLGISTGARAGIDDRLLDVLDAIAEPGGIEGIQAVDGPVHGCGCRQGSRFAGS